MDLISIKRKYRNIRKIIIGIFLLTISIIMILFLREIYLQIKYEKIYWSYIELIEQAKINDQKIAEQKEAERLEKLPQLTEVGKNNLANIYKSESKRVFLTFDDGPSKKVTTPILDILKQENVKATFFLLGSRVELYPEIVKRQYDEGHYLASHGYSHVYSQIYTSPQSVLDEYNKTLTSIRNAIGAPEYNPHLFRFPGGYNGGKYEAWIVPNASKKDLCDHARSLLNNWKSISHYNVSSDIKKYWLKRIPMYITHSNLNIEELSEKLLKGKTNNIEEEYYKKKIKETIEKFVDDILKDKNEKERYEAVNCFIMAFSNVTKIFYGDNSYFSTLFGRYFCPDKKEGTFRKYIYDNKEEIEASDLYKNISKMIKSNFSK